MCIKMRKIIFRINMTLLVHKSKDHNQEGNIIFFFFAQVQEITIFPSVYIF